MQGYLAIDQGARRSGFAASDALGIALEPLPVCQFAPLSPGWLAHLERLLKQRDVGTLVLGLPLNLDGSESGGSHSARELAEELRKRYPGFEVALQDERLSSKQAEEWLREQGVFGKQARQLRDSTSAMVILHDYLHSRR